MAKSIQHKLFFSYPPEVVWEYLTKTELLALWLMECDIQPVVGHDFQFRTKPIPALNFDGNIYCKVLEVISPKKLSYSWKGGPGKGQVTFDSIVVWTLHQKDNGTELSLDHSGFTDLTDINMYNAMNEGWLKNMQKIPVLINAATHGTTNP